MARKEGMPGAQGMLSLKGELLEMQDRGDAEDGNCA